MESTNDERWIRRAIELAAEARARGDEPFGALLVHDGEVVMEARNAVNTESDLTQHAELRLLSKASRQIPAETIASSTLYTSTEPCPMCAGAIYWARVARTVFGLSASRLLALANQSGERNDRSGTKTGPVLETEAATVHDGFW